MRLVILAAACLVGSSLLTAAPNATALELGMKYSSCKQLNKKFKNGVAMSTFFAGRAVDKGYLRPKVNSNVYWANEVGLEASGQVGYLCPRTPPPPPLNEPSAVESLQVVPMRVSSRTDTPGIGVCFGDPGLGNERGDVRFDIFVNGQLWQEGVKRKFATGTTCSDIFPAIEITPLAAGTAYTIGVRARNDRGVGPILEAATTTPPQQAFDRYGQTLISYEVSGSGGSYAYTIETSGGGTSQGNTGNGVFYEEWFSSDKFIYMSVQNRNESGSVTCTIKRNGVVYKTTTSNGAYVIATCSGKS